MLAELDHIGLVMSEQAAARCERLLVFFGYLPQYSGVVNHYGVVCIFFVHKKLPTIEIVIPDTDSPLNKFVQSSPSPMHHIAIKCEGIIDKDWFVGETNVVGAKPGMKVSFLDPKLFGLLVEVVSYD